MRGLMLVGCSYDDIIQLADENIERLRRRQTRGLFGWKVRSMMHLWLEPSVRHRHENFSFRMDTNEYTLILAHYLQQLYHQSYPDSHLPNSHPREIHA